MSAGAGRSWGAGLGLAWRVLRGEGPRAVVARTLDRLAEGRRRRRFANRPATWRPAQRVPVLNVLPMPPAPRLGGVPIQLLARLDAEERQRPVALLCLQRGGGWRLEVSLAGQRSAIVLPGPALAPTTIMQPAFGELVRRAMRLAGADLLHVEGLADVPAAELLALRPRLPRLVLSLHDFAAFCPRPHLIERPQERFCCYCRDLARCGRCLAVDWPVDGGWQGERRRTTAELLAVADALVFPSAFIRRAHCELFPALAIAREPALATAELAGAAAGKAGPRQLVVPPAPRLPVTLPPARAARPVRHLAYVGSVKLHKGAGLLPDVVEQVAGAAAGVRWTVYGGGDHDLLARLRQLPAVRVRGFYRAGTLPRLLRDDGVDLALLLSTGPESHALTLDECRAAGVPCLAFDHSALGERLRLGGGLLVPPEAGAAGVAAALLDLLASGRPAPAVPEELRPTAAAAEAGAAAMIALYGELGSGG